MQKRPLHSFEDHHQMQGHDLLGPIAWIDRIFDTHLKSRMSPLSEIKLPRGKSCVINDPHITMTNPYLGSHLQPCLDMVADALMKEPSSRFKPVVVTLRGVGCGKTRLLEEVRLATNKFSDTIVLSVTFNNLMEYFASRECFTSNTTLNIILSTLMRYVAVVYQVDFDTLCTLFISEAKLLDPSVGESIVTLSIFTRRFLQRIISDIESRMITEEPEISSINVVFIVDEIMAVYDKTIMGSSSGDKVKISFTDAISIMHKAVLNERFTSTTHSVSQINSTLVISSLDVSATQVTDSERIIDTLPYDEELDPVKIVNDWWVPGVELSSVDRFRLELISQTALTQPRVLSFMAEFVRKHVSELLQGSDISPAVSANFIQGIFSAAFKLGYNVDVRDVNYKVLYALVFGKSIKLTNAGMKMLRRSIITNALPSGCIPNPMVVPRGSFIMLAYLSGRSLNLMNKTPPQVDLLNPFDCFFMLLRSTMLVLSGMAEGASLESITEWWLKCRLAVAHASGRKSINLKELFPMLKGISLPQVAVPTSTRYYIRDTKSEETVSLPNISVQPNVTITQIAHKFNSALDLDFDDERFCFSFESPAGQGFDHFVAMLTAVSSKSPTKDSQVFVTVIDNKSAMVKPDKKSKGKKLNYSQFERFLELVEELRKLNQEGELELSSISRALVEGRYRFVYLTTYPNLFNYLKHPNLLISDEESSKSFYGMSWPLVRSLRSASSK